MDIFGSSRFIEEYSKRILSFAYDKTGNIYDAEDLSQEILISLFVSMPKYPAIENMDGFVYTICHHCWSKYCRKHKKHWHSIDIDEIQDLSDDSDVPGEVADAIFIEKMKREIAYLSKLRRDIMTMTYYDGKSSAQVSGELNISDSTVRWHLAETRKKLKGRIENMDTENLNCRPISLKAFGKGKTGIDLRGIGHYRLVDNICYVCYGEPLTVEEIAQRLSVAAAFVEPHLEELVYMDFMKTAGKNRYQTDFFIRTNAFLDIAKQYNYENIKNYAVKLYDALEKRYGEIKDIEFAGSDTDKDFLMWVLLPLLIKRLETKASEILGQKKEYHCCMPKRKDGAEAWLLIIKPKDIFGAINDYDKTLIARYAEMGLVQIDHAGGDKISMLIPYLKKDEYDKLDKILLDIEGELGDGFFVDYLEGYMKKAKAQIPGFLSENERNFVAAGISSLTAAPYYLSTVGKLRYPTEGEAKRLGTIIWEVK